MIPVQSSHIIFAMAQIKVFIIKTNFLRIHGVRINKGWLYVSDYKNVLHVCYSAQYVKNNEILENWHPQVYFNDIWLIFYLYPIKVW